MRTGEQEGYSRFFLCLFSVVGVGSASWTSRLLLGPGDDSCGDAGGGVGVAVLSRMYEVDRDREMAELWGGMRMRVDEGLDVGTSIGREVERVT